MGLKDKYYICTFDTKNMAIYLSAALERQGHKGIQLISTPCEIKAGCNYSIKFNDLKYLDILEKEVAKLGIKINSIYLVDRICGKRTIKKLPT